jgi:hypothetical protein
MSSNTMAGGTQTMEGIQNLQLKKILPMSSQARLVNKNLDTLSLLGGFEDAVFIFYLCVCIFFKKANERWIN